MMGGDEEDDKIIPADNVVQDTTTNTPPPLPPVEDPWAVPSTDNNEEHEEEEAPAEDTSNPLLRLRQSTTRLTSSILTSATNLETRLHLKQNVQSIDAKYNLSDSVSNTTKKLATAFGSLKLTERVSTVTTKVTEETSQLGTKTREIGAALNDAVARPVSIKIQEEVAPAVSRKCEDWGVNDSFRVAGQKVKELDEQIGLSAKTAQVSHATVEKLADGADWLSNNLAGEMPQETQDNAWDVSNDLSMEPAIDAATERLEDTTDKEGFPSSFTKSENDE